MEDVIGLQACGFGKEAQKLKTLDSLEVWPLQRIFNQNAKLETKYPNVSCPVGHFLYKLGRKLKDYLNSCSRVP